MAERTSIEWCHSTFNAWTGCTKVSPACDHCYAEAWAKRSGLVKWGHGEQRRRTTPANWREPLKWDKRCAGLGIRERVFCNSLSDVFDAEAPNEWRDDLMALIEATPNLYWLLLTKRPKVMREYFERRGSVPENVWAGTTVENQAMAELRIPDLLETPARRRFLSCEPLLGELDLKNLLGPEFVEVGHMRSKNTEAPIIHWVIAGGESGKDFRPMLPDWARSLRDQCQDAKAAFFFKQWSGRNPKPLGRYLDGREWNEVPPTPARAALSEEPTR